MVASTEVLTPDEYTPDLYALQGQYREYLAVAERNSEAVRTRVLTLETEIAKFTQGIVATDGKPATCEIFIACNEYC